MASERPLAARGRGILIVFLCCFCWMRCCTMAHSREEFVCGNIDIRNSVEQFKRLENCTVIEGFLQILLIDKGQTKDYDNLAFPKLIEITGYLFMYRAFGLNSVGKLFPNLSVIRGNVLFHNYALVIFEMYQLQEIGLPKLTDILRGSVRFEKNPSLCYVETIDWDRIARSGQGGHYISGNKKWEECPNTCPEPNICSLAVHSGGKQHHLCWNPYHCQKVCPRECEQHNLTCSANSYCCHQECLGGCTGTSSLDCIACKHVVYKGRCLNKCPPNTYEYMGRRCVEEHECKNFTKETGSQSSPIYWKPFDNQCLQECPPGYTEGENKHTCKKCKSRCPKVCDGQVVDNVAAAQTLHGCTFINGSLEIHIQGGTNVIKELEENLNRIQEIQGYLKIARSLPLLSLNFLKELTVIHGEQLDKKNYALLVLDNQNLQELWDWKHRKKRLRILRGKIFFHFNSKLCLSKINELKKYADTSDWDDRDVSPSSNGDRIACDVTNMNVTVHNIGARIATVSWKSFRSYIHDPRSLLGYVIYYREAPFNNVTIFEGRDACGSDVWKVKDVELEEDAEVVNYLLTNLKPFTQYALYIRTYTTASGRQGAQSSIVYFTTQQFTPSPPINVKARSTLHGEIVISWKEPKTPNGNVTHYIVEGVREIDSPDFINQRNYCSEPLTLPGYKKTNEDESSSHHMWLSSSSTTTSSSVGKDTDCCECDSEDTQLLEDEEDAEFQIHFEDFLHNNVYIKNPEANRERRTRSVSKPSTVTSLDTVTSPTAVINSTANKTDDKGDVYENGALIRFQRSVYHHTFLVISNLKHFTEYTIKVQACQDFKPDLKSDYCSSKAITTVRTQPLGGADDIRSSTIYVHVDNVTAKNSHVRFEEPSRPNGVIVAYHIEYKKLDAENYKPIQMCITRTSFLQYGGYYLTELAPGNYSVRVRATSLAGIGNWTQPVYLSIPVMSNGLSPEILIVIVIAALLFVFVISGGFYFKFKKKDKGQPQNVMYTSVNPEYLSAGLVYEPDEWEIPREKIKLIKELGQGSFGMVYEGEIISSEEEKPPIRCAAKTVNDSASLRERIEFLQEASVMKAFNCQHVIKLLGVVSSGPPTLVIMELMANGDLKSYLRSHRPDTEEYPDRQPPSLKRILQMAAEICDGMAYLTAKKFVHRDLAARNCMVAEDLTVKIGDFGMTRDIYETDYYRKGGKGLLPVRWMAPESLKDGVFDSQSDIWSFGVVLWEMATLASQPYQGLSNEQVLKYVLNGGKMEKPENCPEKLFNLMMMCWDINPKARPTFIEIIEMLLPEVNEKFPEVSFYFTQRSSMCPHEIDLVDVATPTTPLRSSVQNDDHIQFVNTDDQEDIQFFPSVTQLPDENVNMTSARNGNQDYNSSRETNEQISFSADNKGVSSYSNDSSKGLSLNYSDDSKGSKISNISNGTVANGHINFSSGRTSNC